MTRATRSISTASDSPLLLHPARGGAQKANSKNARGRVPKRASGPILAPHRLGPDPVSFQQWLSWPEVLADFPAGTDEELALLDLRKLDRFGGSRAESSKVLRTYIKFSPLYGLRGDFWYCHRIFFTIFRGYAGMLEQKDRNRKALVNISKPRQRAAERAEIERLRKAAHHDPLKKARYSTSRLEALRSRLPPLLAEIERRVAKFDNALSKLDAARCKLAATEAKIKSLELLVKMPATATRAAPGAPST